MDENKHPTQAQREKHKESPTDAASNITSRRAFSKRWLYPALYLGAAALIIGLMYIKSQSSSAPTMTNVSDTGGVSPSSNTESFISPIKAGEGSKLTVGFFPVQGTTADQSKALVLYDNTWYPHQGYDLKPTTGTSLDVVAAASGTVTKVISAGNPVNGKTVEITSSNGYTELYESLGTINVKQGDQVTQGDIIGTSGTCLFEASQGNHVYFEVDKNGQAVNPATVLPSN